MVEAAGEEVVVDELPVRYFPPGFLLVGEYCGPAVMWGLFKAFSGARVQVPRGCPGGDHALTLALGMEGCAKLIESFGGSVINVPKCDAAKRAQRDVSIRAMVAKGRRVNAIACEMGLTYRQVQKICRGVAKEAAMQNFDLFE